MSRPTLDRRVVIDVSWWHWALTIPLLAAHLTGSTWAIAAAMGLCAAAGGYFFGTACDGLGFVDVPLTHGIGAA